ncbi:MAG: hypothetical protein ABIQ60_13020 [Burkholderiaceae bacterium]
MKKPIVTYPLTWMVVVALALVLAIAAPRGVGVLGRLPADVGKTLERKQGDERILALVTFNRSQRKDAEVWISALGLHSDQSITWVRMPVVNDPGDPLRRAAAQNRLLAHYASARDRSNLLPVFFDRQAFARSAGLLDTDTLYVLVINRNGDVLARVSGAFDENKARTLRDTLLSELHGL